MASTSAATAPNTATTDVDGERSGSATTATPTPRDDERGDKNALVWEIYSRKDGLVYAVCDGYKEFLREPASPRSTTSASIPGTR